ncbi:MAG: ferritin [Bacteroidales bacterium]|nr:ferritin [Bacteroidales bacterium]HNW72108.1 ferritin [Bacteroidales bacterium]HPS49149.1 ferritin [Bacteroidales bacterium]
MITKNVEKAINEQIKREEHSSRIYLAMASWAERNGFPGAADWLYAQTEEERIHMLKLVHYLNDRGGTAVIPALEAPESKFKTLVDLFQQVLKHEEYISSSINDLYAICVKEKDYTTGNYLQWYINEQIEEESTVRSILDQIKLAGPEKGGLFLMDKEFSALAVAKRTSLAQSGGANAVT